MQICQKHWDAIRAEIERRGLSHLVSKNEQEVAERIENGEIKKDPLIRANTAILMAYLNIFQENQGRLEDGCPLCHVEQLSDKEIADSWVTGCVDGVYTVFAEEGYLGTAQ